MSTLPAQGPRRQPLQERSQETVARIRAAAARLLARGLTPAGLTTAQIAAEAGLSVGGLYRFFPDKQAVIDAIALAHLERFQEALATQLMLALPPTPAALLGAAIDGFVAYLDAHPDFRTLAYPALGARAISAAQFEAQAGGDVTAAVCEVLEGLFTLPAGSAEFRFRLRIATEIADRLIAHALAQPDAAARTRVLAEARRIVADYLFAS